MKRIYFGLLAHFWAFIYAFCCPIGQIAPVTPFQHKIFNRALKAHEDFFRA